ncbi:MAG: hypothetical protein MJA83_03405 [Gammaproteobacteria bacterium]|nr:hypothetical protein [Gammaproteobacteria bacterium]
MPVPQDGRHIANQEGSFVPQHGNNWLLEVADLVGADDRDLIFLSLVSFELPKESSEEIELRYGNEIRYVAGQNEYEAIPLIVRDYVDRAVRNAMVEWRRQVYDPLTGNVGLPTNYKKTGNVILQATDGTFLRNVRLIGLWPQALNAGTLSMDSAEPVQIEATMRYDRIEWSGLA